LIFKLAFIALTAGALFYFLVATRKSALQRLFLLFFFGTGMIFIVQPELTNQIAHLVGIGRGADLIFYLSTLTLFFCCFHFYLRFQLLDRDLTRLTRQLALRHPVRTEREEP
jgi:small membrane protein